PAELDEPDGPFLQDQRAAVVEVAAPKQRPTILQWLIVRRAAGPVGETVEVRVPNETIIPLRRRIKTIEPEHHVGAGEDEPGLARLRRLVEACRGLDVVIDQPVRR